MINRSRRKTVASNTTENVHSELQKFLPKRLKLIEITLSQIQDSKVVLKRLTDSQIRKYKQTTNSKTNNKDMDLDKNSKNGMSLQNLQSTYPERNPANINMTVTRVEGICQNNLNNVTTSDGVQYKDATTYYQCILCSNYGICKKKLLEHYELVHRIRGEDIFYSHYNQNYFINGSLSASGEILRRINCSHKCRSCHHSTLNLNHALYHANQLQTDFTCGVCSYINSKSDLKAFPNWRQLLQSFLIVSTNVYYPSPSPTPSPPAPPLSLSPPPLDLRLKKPSYNHNSQIEKKYDFSKYHFDFSHLISNFNSLPSLKNLSLSMTNTNENQRKVHHNENGGINLQEENNMVEIRESKKRKLQNRLVFYSCKICGKNSKKRKGLLDHLREHVADYAYICMECPVKFVSLTSIKHHLSIHHPNSKIGFKFELKQNMDNLCLKKIGFKHKLSTININDEDESIPIAFPANSLDKVTLKNLTWTTMAYGKSSRITTPSSHIIENRIDHSAIDLNEMEN
ncbi:DgyrCDS399 [Dimorphilus gyrociliatus]|uniref:DgyrCDS399 n=1 Tax=Dimorphilus gyrociliatus TaxID=2664684 RepID=A0A7I8V690_9ANNE|nr:DgyrCDS399 [Dimorphilus gyrociliatus]